MYASEILADPIACLSRAILSPTNKQVDSYNDTILHAVQGTSRIYLVVDSLTEVDEQGLTAPDSVLDYIAQHAPPGLPPHSLTIKTNAVFRLVSHRQTLYINAHTSLYKVCDYARGFARGALLLSMEFGASRIRFDSRFWARSSCSAHWTRQRSI